MRVRVEMIEDEIRTAIVEYLTRIYGVHVRKDNLHVEVKSKQNYKSEWEQAAIRVAADLSAEEM